MTDPASRLSNFALSVRARTTYHRPAMTRPQIELSIKLFIVLLIIAFSAAVIHVLRMLGIF
ncbi:MAG: hypothetical protein MUF31_17570 [Akkermansiaceae bacterium]|jgi:hypothetical protein|nr:hypothetical protein [Akkermansiaceae bacterium]